MKKNAIALAVGALCIAPAAQAQIVFGNDTLGTMQVYGKLYPEVIHASSSGATQPGTSVSTLINTSGVLPAGPAIETPGGRTAVDTQNSYLGFRGERKLGSTGLQAIWQLEQSVNFDTGVDSTFSTRNSFLGLGGGFGTVKLGHMDTIYKEYGAAVGMFGISSGNFISPSSVLSKSAAGSSNSSFHLRAANTIQYQSPEFSGFQFGLQYSPDETQNNVPDNGLNKDLWSTGVKYEAGPLYVSAQYEVHKDIFGGSSNAAGSLSNATTAGAHSKDTGMRLSAAYRFGKHKLAADIAQLKYDETGQAAGTKFKSYKSLHWDVGIESKWGGPWRTSIEYVRGQEGTCELTGGASCSTTGLTGDMIAGGVAYDLDKQTFLFALLAKLTNGDSSRYDNWEASTPARGADVTQAALGMAYKF
jgi:predicted porin